MVTKEQAEIIREYYPKLKPQEVADMVGMKKQNVIAYAYRHCISNNRYWNKEEEEYLVKYYGRSTISQIAKRLGRTYRSVLDKISHMELGSYLSNNKDLSVAEVCRLVGRHKSTINKTWTKYGLKIKKRGKFSVVRQEDLLSFMENNPERWNATKCEKWYFEKYDWFQEKHKDDFERMCAERWEKHGS